MAFRVDIGDITVHTVNLWYTIRLNGPATYEFSTDGNETINMGELISGKTIYIYHDSTLDIKGTSKKSNRFHGGGAVVSGFGQEYEDLGKAKCPIDSGKHTKTWTSATDHTILAALLSGTGWTADVTQSSAVTYDSFRVNDSMSIWAGIMQMIRHTSKDVKIDYTNSKIWLYDSLNTTTDWVYTDGVNCRNVTEVRDEPSAATVVVYGKGDGSNQIIGTAGSGTPILPISDPNVITTTEANTRATAELARISSEIRHFTFSPINPTDAVAVGDTISLTDNTLSISDVSLDIVKVKRGVRNGSEFLELEVATSANRRANKTVEELKAQSEMRNLTGLTSMQGSGNLSQWEGIINATSTAGLKIPFYVGDKFVDEAGVLRIESITVDFDVDPYRRGVGTATESDKAPSIDDTTFSGQDNESTEPDDDTTFNNAITFADSWSIYKVWNTFTDHGEAIIFHVQLWVVEWPNPTSAHSAYTRVLHNNTSTYYPSTTGLRLLRGVTEQATDSDTHNHAPTAGVYFMESDTCSSWDHCSTATANDSHDHQSYSHINGSATIYIPVDPYDQEFAVQLDHSDSGNATAGFFAAYYIISQHKHGDGDYKTDNHKHDVAVGDAVSDAAGVNATNVTIYLEEWNGASWDTIVTYTPSPAKTLDTDVDLSSGGTYPDEVGWWRIRIITNSASPDLIQAVVSIKHNLDN